MRNALLGPAYLLLLPAVAWLHVRHRPLRGAGTILATSYAVAALLLGLTGELVADAQPAALFALGVWWWTVGKLWAQTGALPAGFGVVTAGAAIVALLASVTSSGYAPLVFFASFPELDIWRIYRVAIAMWAIALAIGMGLFSGSRPSRLRPA